MSFLKPKFYTIHPDHSENEIYLSSGLNPHHQLDEIILKKNDVTECYPDARTKNLLKEGAIIEVSEDEYKSSKTYYKKSLRRFLDTIITSDPLDIREKIQSEFEQIPDKLQFISDIKLLLHRNTDNYEVIIWLLDEIIKNHENHSPIGIKTNFSQKQIERLYSFMKNEYVECSKEEFKLIFSVEPISVEWKDSNILLAYFIKNCSHIKDSKKWRKAEQIFGIKNLQQSINNNPYPKGYEKIDEILQQI